MTRFQDSYQPGPGDRLALTRWTGHRHEWMIGQVFSVGKSSFRFQSDNVAVEPVTLRMSKYNGWQGKAAYGGSWEPREPSEYDAVVLEKKAAERISAVVQLSRKPLRDLDARLEWAQRSRLPSIDAQSKADMLAQIDALRRCVEAL